MLWVSRSITNIKEGPNGQSKYTAYSLELHLSYSFHPKIPDIEIYKCITEQIDTDRVIVSETQLLHMAEHHPEAYTQALIELKSTIRKPDYIFRDDKHENTGLVVKHLSAGEEKLYIVLRICTDSQGGTLANSVISGWKISAKRFENYVRNKTVLYKRP